MQISVVIPTYKRPKLLLRCLEALSRQHFDMETIEVIVVSDGPDRQTWNVLAEWNDHRFPWLRYLETLEKSGPAAARNHGWRNANASMIVFTDDDCIPDKNWLLAFFKRYQKEEHFAFTGNTIVPVPEKPTDYERNIANLQTADFITANCCCSTKTLELTGGFDERFAMAWREDSDLEFRLMEAGIPIYKVSDAVVTHPVRKASWGISIREQKKTLYNALLYKKFPKLYRQQIQQTPPVLYYSMLLAFSGMLTGLLATNKGLVVSGLTVWLVLLLLFIYRRLKNNSLAPGHCIEMILTSVVIPFLSIYWQWYGAIKYRVLLI